MRKKAPAGAHLVAQSLEKKCFMYLRHKNRESPFMKNKRCYSGGKEAPAGAHPVAPSLESTCFMYLRHANQDSLFAESNIVYFLIK